MEDPAREQEMQQTAEEGNDRERRVYLCDRCGTAMVERSCKIVCPNCGNRFDCSDVNIYFD